LFHYERNDCKAIWKYVIEHSVKIRPFTLFPANSFQGMQGS